MLQNYIVIQYSFDLFQIRFHYRKYHHPNIINLMSIAFEEKCGLACGLTLILEPVNCSLNHLLFAKV